MVRVASLIISRIFRDRRPSRAAAMWHLVKTWLAKGSFAKTRVIFEKTKILYHYDNTTYSEPQTFNMTYVTIGKVS